MQFVHYDDFKLGVLAGDRVVDISDIAGGSPQDRLETLITNWAELAPKVQAAATSGGGVPLSSVRLRPSVPKPGQLVCAAVNYIEPDRPEAGPFNAFLKSPNSIIGNGDTVELPDATATVFHFEPELALIIGKPASHLTPETAMECVFGYTPFIDVSARGLPGGFFLGKSWHTFAPLGPALVTADEVPDPNKLQVAFGVDGETRQTYSTSDMARHVPQLLAAITEVIALEPGDVVATGVHHVALTPIQGGNLVRVTIERVGPPLEVNVHDASGRTW
jgi:2-keto-4-pentenoate hydratase/2-oxohepta-3-ene-1,7-dioic acid hydratase in catechol pathway